MVINYSMPNRLIKAIIALALLSLTAFNALATVDAQLDRDQINEGDTIALTIKVSGDNDAEPDLSILENEFDIVSQSQSSSFTFNNYQQNSSREWRLQMFPKNVGNKTASITIPEIPVGNEKTPALQVQIKKRDTRVQTNDGSTADPVFIKVSLDTESAYVQQEVIITAQIYQAIALDNMQMSDPVFDNATVKEVNRTTYQTSENGIDYRVHELRYALYPREAGELIIPEFVFSARKVSGASSFFSVPTADMMVRRLSKPVTLNVKPIPAAFTGKVWLPARSLRLKEEWRDDPLMASTGKAITRSVIIEANGLLSAQLPELPQQAINGLQTYPDQPILADQETANGIRSTREQPTALIPTQPGTITLPEVRIIWWDVDNDQQKEAVLPASELNATGAALQTQPPVQAPVSTTTENSTAENNQTDNTEPAPEENESNNLTDNQNASQNDTPAKTDLFSKGIALVGIAGWLVTLILWWLHSQRQKSLRTINDGSSIKTTAQYQDEEKAAFKLLRDSCRANSVQTLRRDLLQWSHCAWASSPPKTLEAIASRIDSAELSMILQQLDAQLYGAKTDNSSINGERLLAIIESWRRHGIIKTAKPDKLPELYDNQSG